MVFNKEVNRESKMEAPSAIKEGLLYPQEVTPTTRLTPGLFPPVCPLEGTPKFCTQGPPLDPPPMSEPYSTLLGETVVALSAVT